MDTVAAHVSATWKAGEAGSDAILSLGGKRVAVRVVTVKWRKGAEPAELAACVLMTICKCDLEIGDGFLIVRGQASRG